MTRGGGCYNDVDLIFRRPGYAQVAGLDIFGRSLEGSIVSGPDPCASISHNFDAGTRVRWQARHACGGVMLQELRLTGV